MGQFATPIRSRPGTVSFGYIRSILGELIEECSGVTTIIILYIATTYTIAARVVQVGTLRAVV